jgi:DNA-binding transcriptional regulator YdaS (Cro superfamily)
VSKELDGLDVQRMLRAACAAAGGQAAFARMNGVSASYLSQVLNAVKPPSDILLSSIGIKRVVKYLEIQR